MRYAPSTRVSGILADGPFVPPVVIPVLVSAVASALGRLQGYCELTASTNPRIGVQKTGGSFGKAL